jgi:hypothetical protein
MIKVRAAIQARELMDPGFLDAEASIGEPEPDRSPLGNTRETALAKGGRLRGQGQSAVVSHFGSNQQSASPS